MTTRLKETIAEPNPMKNGKRYTRKEWERTHKPTCNVYPCRAWPEIHWHISDVKIFNVEQPSASRKDN